MVPKLTAELNRVILIRVNDVPSNEVPNTEEGFRGMATSAILTNLISGIYHKATFIIDYKHLNASAMPLLLSNFRRFYSLITVSGASWMYC